MPSATAIAVAVADAVLQELRTTTATLNPTYGRTYDNDRELKDSGTLHIDVMNAGHKLEPLSRAEAARDPVVQIVVRKKLDNASPDDDQAELDRLTLLLEEIEDLFFLRRLDKVEAVWTASETFGPLNADYHQYRQFTAIIQMTFRVHGDV